MYRAIDIGAESTEVSLNVGAVVMATGWRPYPIENLETFGAGSFANVIANVQMERLAALSGPTRGKILKPSDNTPPKKVAFVQCAGSRDLNHLPYCSGVCCLASLKQALYVKEQLPEAEVGIFYIDRRTPGRNEEMLTKVAAMSGVKMIKGKVGKIESGSDGNLKLFVEDAEAAAMLDASADLVVLATGMVSSLSEGHNPFGYKLDDDGFGFDDFEKRLFVAGVSRRPEDVASSVRDATGTAAKAMVVTGRST